MQKKFKKYDNIFQGDGILKKIINKLNLETKIYLVMLLIIYIKTQCFYFMTWSANNVMLPIITVGIIGIFLMPILFIKKSNNQIRYGVILNIIITILLASNALYYKSSRIAPGTCPRLKDFLTACSDTFQRRATSFTLKYSIFFILL